ncbi:3-isopropylmalate dehydrogenase [Enterocloster clostridioformis]|uniref:3-isopropylmalate dehydrogenase n=1 Tax=Enterocloster clostridioformis TaxID=1531 RepID=UPI00080C8CCC|nr:3-isopropylmalate dehydrogenase [Enterocloster clostridioformis]ANU48332.1 3-isopropylmalate dehydrogenase [Lachnoclostridium sp. YL32]NDO29420.1 3-isopropylmalate dehydrogenase [Enterocloster clostridioformis]OXE68962.1 3-isopropylmalate dehydrogenase [Enterocloster clostridioformis]QQR02779.1 3-isopropylmalate dehydrogenase [Enterocloster clostridioformis]
MDYNVTVIPGDGIGPEIVREARKVLDQVGRVYGHSFDYTEILMGGCSIDAYGVPLTEEALETAGKSDAVLLGAVGGDVGNSRWYDVAPNLRPEAGLLAIRKGLGLFANIRPAYLYKELAEACPLKKEIIGDGFDMVIMRELTGGLYFGDRYTREVDGVMTAVDTLTYNEKEIRRIAVKAFDIAMKRRKKVTSVDKANVLDSSRLWRKVVEEVAGDYPEVELSHMLVDNCAMQLVMNPGQFDVILTENMFGDILSDEASMITGSIGMLSSASMNESKFGLYEPSHGSAPDIAGKDMANPIATILSAAMLLRYSFDLDREADAIENAVQAVLTEGYRTGDIMSEGCVRVGTCKMGDLIAQRIG